MSSSSINIDDLIGVRYKLNGRGYDGFDCYRLVIEVSKRFGHHLPDIEEMLASGYDFNFYKDKLLPKVRVKEIEYPNDAGDVILFSNNIGVLNHIGVYLGDNKVIHCNKLGVHVDKLDSKFLKIGKVYKWL
jgi:cell wall-associated NlpC family hydrolase